MNLKDRALVFKALGHPARLAMVDKLAEGERCVCELMKMTRLSKFSGPTISQHLLVLKNAGIVTDDKRGKMIFYRLAMPCISGISRCVSNSQSISPR
jgi:ArsR family transcriptional regulator